MITTDRSECSSSGVIATPTDIVDFATHLKVLMVNELSIIQSNNYAITVISVGTESAVAGSKLTTGLLSHTGSWVAATRVPLYPNPLHHFDQRSGLK